MPLYGAEDYEKNNSIEKLQQQLEKAEMQRDMLDTSIWDACNVLTNFLNIENLKEYEYVAGIRLATASLMYISDMVNKHD